MSEADLTHYSSWASIISLFLTIVSLWYVKSIRTNIVKFRRKQRLHSIIDDVLRIPDDAIPLSSASNTKINSLLRNIPISIFSRFSERGRLAKDIHTNAKAEKIADLKESINDWKSCSNDIL
jgi:hypothetical protein